MACKKSLASMIKNTLQGQIHIPFAHSFPLLPDDSAGRTARELWQMNLECSSVHHHSTMVLDAHLTTMLGWWLQFKYVFSPHQHNDVHHHMLILTKTLKK
jgi:hypothetical protein